MIDAQYLGNPLKAAAARVHTGLIRK